MKMKVKIAAILWLCFSVAAFGADVQFMWDYSAPAPSGFELQITNLAGGTVPYVVDCRNAPGNSCIVRDWPAGSYTAICLAYNNSVPAELGKVYGPPSNIVNFTVASMPIKPESLGVKAAGSVEMRFDVPDNKIAVVEVRFDNKKQEP